MINPVIRKGFQERLRLKQMIAWGLFTLILTSFAYLTAYLEGSDGQWVYDSELGESIKTEGLPSDGAKTAFPILLGIQGFILMFLGTGQVAAGTAEEREAGLLDYQRMTPMNPFSKIVGYLFGLPGREYFMFALTLPFLVHATIVGGLAMSKVLHLYVVFLSCVLLYHLTAHVTGLIVSKPRAASWVSRMVVLALYVFLPQLGQVGFSFLSSLTLLPTYFGIMKEDLAKSWQQREEFESSPMESPHDHAEASSTGHEQPVTVHEDFQDEIDVTDFWSEVPFFETTISPSLFTILIQGLLLAGLLAAAHRKWRNESMPAFSKPFGVGLFAILQVLLMGSLWQLYGEGRASGLLGGEIFPRLRTHQFWETPMTVLISVQTILFTLSLLAAVLIINVTCPTRHQYLKGKRRSAKLGLPDVPLLADEKPGWLVVLCLALIMPCTHVALLTQAIDSGLYFEADPKPEVFLLPCLFFAACLVYLRAARERWFTVGFWGFLGLLWITPLLVCMVMAVAGEEDALEAIFHVGSISPSFAFFEIAARAHYLGVGPIEESLHNAAIFGTIIAWVIAVFLSITQFRLRRSWDKLEKSIAGDEEE